MTREDVDRLFNFNQWANARTIASAEALTDEQLHRDLKSSFPSVFATLVHMLGAEWIWVERWNGSSPQVWPEMDALKSVADLRARWAAVETAQRAFLRAQDDASLQRPIAYSNMKGEPFAEPAALIAQHVVNHSSYHRGQIATMIRQLGARPQGTDFISFVREVPDA
jgi:uncharacterized damage-inducible protein DinB